MLLPGRPLLSVGHVVLRVSEVTQAAAFYRSLGMRAVVERKEIAILELRGGTHLLLFKARSKPRAGAIRAFDFMVDDADAFHDALQARGVITTPVRDDRHDPGAGRPAFGASHVRAHRSGRSRAHRALGSHGRASCLALNRDATRTRLPAH